MAYSPSGSPVRERTRRHQDYYLTGGDVIFYVEDTFFNVHRYFFERESPVFSRIFSQATTPGKIPRGSSESNPIPLDDVSALDFTRFLWVFYNPTYSLYDNATLDEWVSILKLAELWQFARVKELAVRHIERHTLDAVGRIELYHAYDVDRALLVPAYLAVVLRPAPLSLDEGARLGLETALRLVIARERARAADVRVAGDALAQLVRETFFVPPPRSPLHGPANDTGAHVRVPAARHAPASPVSPAAGAALPPAVASAIAQKTRYANGLLSPHGQLSIVT